MGTFLLSDVDDKTIRERKIERESACVCAYVSMCLRVRECVCVRESVYLCAMLERESVWV